MRTVLYAAALILLAVNTFLDCRHKYAHEKRKEKPVLMPLIMFMYFLSTDRILLQVLAMIGGWLGDIFLMKKEKKAFLAGAAAFMFGHIFYALMYAMQLKRSAFEPVYLIMLVPYIGYGWFVYHKLKDHLPADIHKLARAYIFYIEAMSFLAFCRLGSVSTAGWLVTWLGSITFMVSDTLVSFEKFVNPEIRGVMETYVPAQWMLMTGCVLH